MTSSKTKVVVAMSGGVDSTAAAVMLQQQGYQVYGVTMRTNRDNADLLKESDAACFGKDQDAAIEKAAAVCQRLNIQHTVIDLSQEFKAEIIDDFSRQYLSGRTPNPCVRCNKYFKFGILLQKSLQQTGSEYFATGHYARVQYDRDRQSYRLFKGKDESKDQSYFLYYLSQGQLSRLIFPLGEQTKQEIKESVKKIIPEENIANDSQNFIEGDYSSVLNVQNVQKGNIVDQDGVVRGEHPGYFKYTIGQRKGLGIANPEPLFVTSIDQATNTVYVGTRDKLLQSSLTADQLNWIKYQDPPDSFEAAARIRYRQRAVPVRVERMAKDVIRVDFVEPVEAVTPGQSVVLYDGDIVIGGGVIRGE